jgi:hypothetical protein
VNQFRDAGERDGAAYRAARAARTLAAIANDAAREYVERDGVAPEADGPNGDVMAAKQLRWHADYISVRATGLDDAERERQTRLRRWHEPPHPNRKDR